MERVGWVERSETHHLVRQEAILMGFVSLNPSYPLSERRAIRQGRLAPSKGIAWDDNRSLISSRVNTLWVSSAWFLPCRSTRHSRAMFLGFSYGFSFGIQLALRSADNE
jgi:hypothetical protein